MTPVPQFIASALLVFSLFAAPASAEEVKAGDLVITQAWSRATPGGAKIAGGYLTIENKGAAPDRLIGGAGDVAGKIEVHEMSMNNGVMTMRPLDKGLAIEPGKTVKLAPGGYHLMMLDLKSPLKQGDKVPVTLEFEKAGKVKLSLDVQGVGAQAPAGADKSGGQMDMKKMPDHSGMKMWGDNFVLQSMAGDVSALPAKQPTLTLSLPERADPVSRPLACTSDALVTDFQKITLEDQFDVPAR